jgi:5-(carboxyamino)imidazole ribonucleotide mutase
MQGWMGRYGRCLARAAGLVYGAERKARRDSGALSQFGDALVIRHDTRIVSAHRTPDRLVSFAKGARAAGTKVIIAGAGGAAHLPGMTAAWTTLPVLGVPMETKALGGQDSLYSIVQMPAGIPVGTLAIGRAGAINAALLAASILSLEDAGLATRLAAWRQAQSDAVALAPQDE